MHVQIRDREGSPPFEFRQVSRGFTAIHAPMMRKEFFDSVVALTLSFTNLMTLLEKSDFGFIKTPIFNFLDIFK